MEDESGRYWQKRLLGAPGVEGRKYDLSKTPYLFRDGILRQESIYSPTQGQTQDAFAYKWSRYGEEDAPEVVDFRRKWLVERFLGGDAGLLDPWFPAGARVLDAGCGRGLTATIFFGEALKRIRYLGVDISDAVDLARDRFAAKGLPGEFLQADFTKLPFEGPTFDAILAEGTLHHTDSTEGALKSLAKLLAPGGRILFYVYRRKGPIREFTDDYIRERLRGMPDAQAWDALLPLTKLGKALGELKVTVDVPEAVALLGIPAGPIDLQRLFYWHVFKAFYRPEWPLEKMQVTNFDWFRPANAFRHTEEEIRRWCGDAELEILHWNEQEAGYTVVARRRARADFP